MDREPLKGTAPGAWLLVSIIAMVAVHLSLPGFSLVPRPYGYGGGALVLLGLGVGMWAVRLFRKARTTVEPAKTPNELVIQGPFRFTRHPMYLGMTIALAGVAILLGSATPWVIVPMFFVFVAQPSARAEERVMEDTFGEAYSRYKRSIRRWL